MLRPELGPEQKKAVKELSNGKILHGGVGSGKSRVALAYYDQIDSCGDLYVMTTAKKRDSLDWEREAATFGIGPKGATTSGILTVDSWNNIAKYEEVEGSTFIFDEQRLVGKGAWVKSFYKIARKNAWIILSATPGDTWMDYIPVFVANGFYKNASAFSNEHIVWSSYARFPRVDRFLGEDKLQRLKREVLVDMPYEKHTIRLPFNFLDVEYDKELYNVVAKDRWNPFTEEPIRDAADWFAQMRRVVYSDPSRLEFTKKLLEERERLVIFYNFNYELDILRTLYDTWSDVVEVAEWNGHRKQELPTSDNWAYLVQYQAGAEGWNCTSTDAMLFYSLTYSYKKFEQSKGRIDRRDTLYTFLSYFGFTTDTIPDRAVRQSLGTKKNFNERRWVRENYGDDDYLLVPTDESVEI